MANDSDLHTKILQILDNLVVRDAELRNQYKIGEKFRFIRDRLLQLQAKINEKLQEVQSQVIVNDKTIESDECLVYVYLFNARGLEFVTWNKLINPSVFYEYSINRPIYAERNFVESFIRSRANKTQHGYLSVIVKKTDILPPPAGSKDLLGQETIKVREGSLNFNKVFCFTHVDQDYEINKEGQLKKKI